MANQINLDVLPESIGHSVRAFWRGNTDGWYLTGAERNPRRCWQLNGTPKGVQVEGLYRDGVPVVYYSGSCGQNKFPKGSYREVV